MKTEVSALIFDDFESLDLFGPIEVLGHAPNYQIEYYSLNGGLVRSYQNTLVMTKSVAELPENQILLVPGGIGTRTLVDNSNFIEALKVGSQKSKWTLTVCTGSGLLAKTGLLDGKKATSNKMAFKWAMQTSPKVNWQPSARWVIDGKYYTSSGVSAGTDMALGFIADQFGEKTTKELINLMEYTWHDDKNRDPFEVLITQ